MNAIEVKVFEIERLLAEIEGGIANNTRIPGLLNETISGGAKLRLRRIREELLKLKKPVEDQRLELLVKYGGTKEEGIHPENKEAINAFLVEYSDYIREVSESPEKILIEKVSLTQSKFEDMVSPYDYMFSVEKIFE